MATTDIPETHRDLLDAQFATIATIGPDERPQLSEVWFLSDDDGLHVSLNTTRQKTKNLRARHVATLFILDLENPMRYLEVRGDAEIEPDPDYAFADKVGAKYGADLRQMDGPGEERVVVTIRPRRVNAVDLSR